MVIPTYQSRMQVSGGSPGRALQPGNAGNELAAFGQTLTRVALAAEEQRQTADLAQAKLDHLSSLGNLDQEFANDTDFSTRVDRYGAAAQADASAQVARFPEGSAAAREFGLWAQGQHLNARKTQRARALELEQSNRRAGLDRGLHDLALQAGTAPSDDERNRIDDEAEAAVRDMERAGWISAEEAENMVQAQRRASALNYGNRLMEDDPAEAQAWLSGEFSGASAPVRTAIVGAARRHGVPPDLLARIARVESDFNPNAKNSASTAAGLFQFISSTGKVYGLTGNDSIEAQADAGARLTRDNIIGLQKVLNRPPTDGEIYMAHFLGLPRAQKLLDANPDQSVASIVGIQAVQANPTILQGRTVAQVRALMEQKMGRASGSAPIGLTAGDVTALRARARDRLAAERAEAETITAQNAALFQKSYNSAADMVKGGFTPAPEIFDQLRAGAPDAASRQAIDELDRTAGMVRTIVSSPPSLGEDMLTALETRAATAATPALAAQVETIRNVVSTHRKLVESDPVTAAQRGGLSVPPLDWSNPVAGFAARREAMSAAAARFGVPFKGLTAAEASELSGRMANADPGQRLAMLAAVAEGFGQDAPAVFAQISESSPVAAHAGGLMLMGPQGAAAARDAMRGLELIKEKMPGPGKPEDFADVERSRLNPALPPELDRERRAIAATAKAIYAAMAENSGAAEFDPDLYGHAIDRATGGAIASVNGYMTLIPPGTNGQAFERAVNYLTDETVLEYSADGGRPVDGGGRAVGTEHLGDMYFVAVGPGEYRISVSDPAVEPQYLLDGESGNYFRLVLDPARVERLHRDYGTARDAADRGIGFYSIERPPPSRDFYGLGIRGVHGDGQ